MTYVATLEGAGAVLVQAAARVRGTHMGALAPAFDRALGAWTATGAASLGVRVRFDPNKSGLAVTVFLTAPQSAAAEIRRMVGRLALLEGIDGADVETPQDARTMQELLDDWPGITIGVDAKGLTTTDGSRLACRAVWPSINARVFERLATLGQPIWLHTNITPALAPPEDQKRWMRDLMALDGARGLPADLHLAQTEAVEAARRAAFNVECYWGAADRAGSGRLLSTLDELARALEAAAFRQVAIHSVLASTPDAVADGVHTFIDNDRARDVVGYASQAEAAAARAWPNVSLPQMRPTSNDSGQFGVSFQDMPPVRDQPGCVFISYAHADAKAVYPILYRLHHQNLPYWYDRGIPGGEQWDDELERRLSSSAALLAFLSPRWAASRYCRRELKYADILGKPIAPIMIEQTRLEGGLAFTLSPIQSIDANDPSLIEHLGRFIRRTR